MLSEMRISLSLNNQPPKRLASQWGLHHEGVGADMNIREHTSTYGPTSNEPHAPTSPTPGRSRATLSLRSQSRCDRFAPGAFRNAARSQSSRHDSVSISTQVESIVFRVYFFEGDHVSSRVTHRSPGRVRSPKPFENDDKLMVDTGLPIPIALDKAPYALQVIGVRPACEVEKSNPIVWRLRSSYQPLGGDDFIIGATVLEHEFVVVGISREISPLFFEELDLTSIDLSNPRH